MYVCRDHPEEGTKELEEHIKNFGERNRHLVGNRTNNDSGNRTAVKAAWFVSNCHTKSQRAVVVEGPLRSRKGGGGLKFVSKAF